MTTKKQLIDLCLSYGTTYEDYPFDDNWTAMRHNGNHKVFAFIYQHNGAIRCNLKAEPFLIGEWCSQFSSIVPAYHMNKMHWISIILDDTVPDEIIAQFVDDSFNLTKPTVKRKAK